MHLDLWPAPMRAGLCGGSRLPLCVASPLHRNSEGGQRPKQRPLPFCLPDEATRPGPKAAGGLAQTSVNVEGHHGVICWGSHPAPSELNLPSVRLGGHITRPLRSHRWCHSR